MRTSRTHRGTYAVHGRPHMIPTFPFNAFLVLTRAWAVCPMQDGPIQRGSCEQLCCASARVVHSLSRAQYRGGRGGPVTRRPCAQPCCARAQVREWTVCGPACCAQEPPLGLALWPSLGAIPACSPSGYTHDQPATTCTHFRCWTARQAFQTVKLPQPERHSCIPQSVRACINSHSPPQPMISTQQPS